MTIAEAVRMRLLAISGVTALVVARVYVQILPQHPALPAIRLQRVDEEEPMHLRGSAGIFTARVQVDSVADQSRAGAIALDAAVHGDGAGSGMCGWVGTVSTIAVLEVRPAGVREAFDAEALNQYKVMRDYLITFRNV